MQVLFSRTATKDLRKLPATERNRVLEKVAAYASDQRAMDARKLRGFGSIYGIRVGDWRVIF